MGIGVNGLQQSSTGHNVVFGPGPTTSRQGADAVFIRTPEEAAAYNKARDAGFFTLDWHGPSISLNSEVEQARIDLEKVQAGGTSRGFGPQHLDFLKTHVENLVRKREAAISAGKELYRISNEIDKQSQLTSPFQGEKPVNNVRGIDETFRREAQKVDVNDTAARERRKRRSSLVQARGGGGGSSGSSVTGLSSSTYRKTLLGG